MAAHSQTAQIIPPVPPDQPPGAWASWLREIAASVNLIGAWVQAPAFAGTIASGAEGTEPPAGDAGWAIGAGFNSLHEVDFWSLYPAAADFEGGFAFMQKLSAGSASFIGYLHGTATNAAFDLYTVAGGSTGLGIQDAPTPVVYLMAAPGYDLQLIVEGGAALTIAPDRSAVFAGSVTHKPAAAMTPANNGDLVIEATSDTLLTFRLKGSDGTVRSGSIALA